jgi:hypothetical protein
MQTGLELRLAWCEMRVEEGSGESLARLVWCQWRWHPWVPFPFLKASLRSLPFSLILDLVFLGENFSPHGVSDDGILVLGGVALEPWSSTVYHVLHFRWFPCVVGKSPRRRCHGDPGEGRGLSRQCPVLGCKRMTQARTLDFPFSVNALCSRPLSLVLFLLSCASL